MQLLTYEVTSIYLLGFQNIKTWLETRRNHFFIKTGKRTKGFLDIGSSKKSSLSNLPIEISFLN